MSTLQKLVLVSVLSLSLPLGASAQSVSDIRAMSPEERHTFMQSMSDDERAAMRERWRAEFDALPEEEKQAIWQRRAERMGARHRNRVAMRERWETMSDEERAAARERHQARRDERRQRRESMSVGKKAEE